jgi:hypothetical protein
VKEQCVFVHTHTHIYITYIYHCAVRFLSCVEEYVITYTLGFVFLIYEVNRYKNKMLSKVNKNHSSEHEVNSRITKKFYRKSHSENYNTR